MYDSTLHELEVYGHLETLQRLLELASRGFPTMIHRRTAAEAVTPEAIHWLTEHNVIGIRDEAHYGLIDEFLRIRMLMDSENTEVARAEREQDIIDREYRRARAERGEYDDV